MVDCPQCGAGFEPLPGRTGRPQAYCSTSCRRAREYAIKRAQRAVERADRELTLVREEEATTGGWYANRRVPFWEAEILQRREALDKLLAD